MKIACLSFSELGRELGDKLKNINNDKYKVNHYINKEVEGGIKSILPNLWKNYDGLIFISSTGMGIRLMNQYIKHKTIDPAVVVIDDMGRFAISLLSGHLGGANDLANHMGKEINAIPVITTASDNRGIEALDLFARKNNYYIENKKDLTKIMGMMVDGKNIGFYSEENKIIDYPNLHIIKSPHPVIGAVPSCGVRQAKNLNALIIVSSNILDLSRLEIPYIILRPKNINLGIGCRKGVEGERIIRAIKEALEGEGLSINSIKAIGTVEVKKDEKGIIKAAQFYNCPMKIFTIDEIKEVEDKFEKSQFVKDTIGVYSVSEPSAYLLGGKIIKEKQSFNGITISIAKEMDYV